jgi:hypothetical protein
VVKVTEKVFPGRISPELNSGIPCGATIAVAVCGWVSLFTHSIVLLIPIVTVMLTGYGYAPVANSVWNWVRLKPEGSM